MYRKAFENKTNKFMFDEIDTEDPEKVCLIQELCSDVSEFYKSKGHDNHIEYEFISHGEVYDGGYVRGKVYIESCDKKFKHTMVVGIEELEMFIAMKSDKYDLFFTEEFLTAIIFNTDNTRRKYLKPYGLQLVEHDCYDGTILIYKCGLPKRDMDKNVEYDMFINYNS